MDQEEARNLLKVVDPAAAEQLVVQVANELDGLAAQIWAFAMSEGSRRALAVVAQMGSELAVASAQLYEANRWYAGAALVRQLIEAEYLLFLFATDPPEAGKWMAATSDEARKMFRLSRCGNAQTVGSGPMSTPHTARSVDIRAFPVTCSFVST